MFPRLTVLVAAAMLGALAAPSAQTPQPFPKPGQAAPAGKPPATPAKPPVPAPTPSQPRAVDPNTAPTEETLGVPLYPSAQFITSYDAGRGQRFYLFGVTAPYAEMVLYYRNALKQRGSELFESPPTHQFDIGRFREDAMAFPPSVTVKDYTWGGSPGYPNPKRDSEPQRFATIIQIVPAPPGSQQ